MATIYIYVNFHIFGLNSKKEFQNLNFFDIVSKQPKKINSNTKRKHKKIILLKKVTHTKKKKAYRSIMHLIKVIGPKNK